MTKYNLFDFEPSGTHRVLVGTTFKMSNYNGDISPFLEWLGDPYKQFSGNSAKREMNPDGIVRRFNVDALAFTPELDQYGEMRILAEGEIVSIDIEASSEWFADRLLDGFNHVMNAEHLKEAA